MSTRASVTPAMAPVRGRCAVCGDPDWQALWSGHQVICICARCAVQVLPRLIADATSRPHMPPDDAAAILDQVRAEYWRAVAIGLMRPSPAGDHAERVP